MPDFTPPSRPVPRPIAFLTDYGTRDGFAAVCHGVIATIAPAVRVVDVTHDVPPHDVRHGAAVLARVAAYLPPAVYLGVVDPGVGTARRAVAVVAGAGVLVGPDNGLLLPAAEVLGGVTAAYVLSEESWWLPRRDATFHGRDLFAPVAARIAAGSDPSGAGAAVEPASLAQLPAPRTHVGSGTVTTEVTYVDRYGNVQLAVTDAQAVGRRAARRRGRRRTRRPPPVRPRRRPRAGTTDVVHRPGGPGLR